MAKTVKQAIVVGASSGIGAEIARQLASTGCRVALVARREEELHALNQSLPTPGKVFVHDVRRFEEVPALFQEICRELGGLDAVFYTAGILPRQGAEEFDFALDKLTVEINVLGLMAWGHEAAQRFKTQGEGVIVGISSVAADRGRRGMLSYAASKAATDTYLESLRNRVGRYGVRVVTMKPGPVDTPMIAGMPNMPFMISVEVAAQRTIAAAQRGATTVYVPFIWRPIMGVIRLIPSFVFQKLNL